MGQGRGKRGRRTRSVSLDSDLMLWAKLCLSKTSENLKYGNSLHMQKIRNKNKCVLYIHGR